jgi:hypothetical protein
MAIALNLLGPVQPAEHMLRAALPFTSSTKLVDVDRAVHVLNRFAIEDDLETQFCNR